MSPTPDPTGKPEAETRACFLPDSETEAFCELPGPPKPENVVIRPTRETEEPEQFQAWETLNEWF